MPIKYYWVLIILGIAVGISGVIFNSGILKTQKMFKESKLNRYVKIMIPFFVTGIIGMISPILTGGGHELIMELQSTDFMLMTLVVFLVIKFIFNTFVCFGSGVPGGILPTFSTWCTCRKYSWTYINKISWNTLVYI